MNFYRPQRSCGKVMFLHRSVILSTAGEYLPLVPGCVSATPLETKGRHPDPCGQTPPLAECMLGYGQKAGSRHLTGMHSCYNQCLHKQLILILNQLNPISINCIVKQILFTKISREKGNFKNRIHFFFRNFWPKLCIVRQAMHLRI